MAVNPDDVHAISIATVAQYREAELKLLALIASYLSKGMDAPTWAEDRLAAVSALRRAAQLTLGELEQNTSLEVRQHLAEAYRTGYGTAVTALGLEQATQDAARAATTTVTRVAAMESLAAAVMTDIGERSQNVLRHVMDVYRAVVLQSASVGVAAGLTRRQASQDAYARFVAKGVTSFTDAAGRTWRLSSYVEMALRTVTQRAAVQGQEDRQTSLGLDLMVVSDSPGECEMCRPFENKILSISGAHRGRVEMPSVTTGELVTVDVLMSTAEARVAGLWHPNCTHAGRAYLPGATKIPTGPTADPELNEAKTRQREIERHIRGWKEREAAALTPEAKTAATRKVRAWQGEMRQHLEDNPKLKRLPYREQIGAGNLPPRGDGLGGRKPKPPPVPDDGLDTMEDHQLRSLATEFEIPNSGELDRASLLQELRKAGAVSTERHRQMMADEKAEITRRQTAAAKARYHPDLTGLEDLVADAEIAARDGVRTTLSGGAVGVSEQVGLPDGRNLFSKDSGDWYGRPGTVVTDSEQLVALVGRAMGAPVPRVFRDSETHIWTDWAEGRIGHEWFTNKLLASLDGPPDNDFLRGVVDSGPGRRLGLLDLITQNQDRHTANWLVTDDGHLTGIDHGNAWWDVADALAQQSDEGFAQVVRGELGGVFVRERWFDQDRLEQDGTAIPVDTDIWTQPDVAEVRHRLQSLRRDFARFGHEAWLDYSLRVLDLLEPYARGTRSIFDD